MSCQSGVYLISNKINGKKYIGTKWPPDVLEKISKAMKGKPWSEARRVASRHGSWKTI
jgi:hypothetical protein